MTASVVTLAQYRRADPSVLIGGMAQVLAAHGLAHIPAPSPGALHVLRALTEAGYSLSQIEAHHAAARALAGAALAPPQLRQRHYALLHRIEAHMPIGIVPAELGRGAPMVRPLAAAGLVRFARDGATSRIILTAAGAARLARRRERARGILAPVR